ncbi:MAG: methyltransferase domain-containing protein [Planctomycetaceae bacterium]|nr:methyltransferase domain-containing protein [Planctomycetaceae bacterium]
MNRFLSENVLFFREYVRHFRTTGAVLPSGRRLGVALTRFLREKPVGPRKILEVGPGTGAVTRHIVRGMAPGDHLDLVELNDTFVAQLERRFQADAEFRAVAERAQVRHCPVESLPGEDRYDVIVSGLPLNNFSVAEVEHLLSVLCGRLAPKGTLSFFEYIAIRSARALVSGASERARLRGIGRAMDSLLDKHQIHRDAVWLNVPPAWVHHVQI